MDKVRPLKIEKISGGGSQDNLYPHDLDPNEDGVEARGVILQNDSSNDTTVELSRDASNNMTFKDGVVSGTQTLSDLLGGEGSDDDQVDKIIADEETFTVKLEHQHILFQEIIVDGEYIVNGESVILEGDEVGGGSGEVNTASNVGTAGVGLFKQKVSVDLQFKKLNAGSSKVTITDDTGNSEVDVDVVPGNIAHQDLSGAGTNAHSAIDTHLGSTSNPHATDVENLGSGTLAELNSAITDATLDDSSDARTPTSHAASHNAGGGDAMAIDAAGGTGSLRTLGTASTTACAGDDSRLSDARTPTSHASTHNAGGGDALAIDAAAATGSLRTLGTASTAACAGDDSRLSDARTPTSHASSHNAGGGDALAIDAAAGTGSLRTLGTASTTACAGDDSRLSDARTPTSHASSHNAGGGDAMAIDAAAGTGSLRTLGTVSTAACAGNDSRLSDARTPTSHATSHQSGGGDAIKLDDLSAPDDNTDLNATTSAHGLLPKLGGGTTNFLRADGTWNQPAGGSGVLLQRKGAEVTSDTSTTSTSFVDLLTVSITTGANVLDVLFTVGVSGNGKDADQADFRITVDGSAKRGTTQYITDGPGSAALSWRGAATEATHSVKIQWKINDDEVQIRPVSAPDSEHATLIVTEYTQ